MGRRWARSSGFLTGDATLSSQHRERYSTRPVLVNSRISVGRRHCAVSLSERSSSYVLASGSNPWHHHPAFLDCRTEAIGRNACRTPQELPRQSIPFSTHRMGRCSRKPILRTHLARLPVGFSIFYKIPKKFIAAYPPANKRRSNLASAQRGRGTLPPSAARRWRGQASRDRDGRVG